MGPYDIRVNCVALGVPSGSFVTGEVLTVDGGGQQWGEVWPLGRPAHFRVDPGS